jgi:UDP-2,4-diacetamido-2,4,6-trideoxy-beta-L-altropyranose hydrolase
MNVLIRTDASEQIGSGHVMRCLTLADGLREHGARVLFSCSKLKGNLCELIAERGYEVISPLENGVKGELLVVDHYGLDKQWEGSQRPYFKHILVIDDLANRNHDCDFLLDQNLAANWQTRYAGKVPETCKLLLGPQYALLAPIYAELHERIPPREGQVKRILVSFGGGDYEELYAKVMADFLSLNRPDIHLDMVIPGRHHLESKYANIKIHDRLPSLAPLMAKADLAIGAAGSTSWERLCLGLPSLVMVLADNQVEIAKELNRRELVRFYEPSLLACPPKFQPRQSELPDGRGLSRILSILMANKEMPLRIRHANLKDEAWLLELANDPASRQNSFSIEKIAPETHKAWFYEKLKNFEQCCLYIAETSEGFPIGQVRFELQDNGSWELSYALAPNFRGVGLGKIMLGKAIEELRSTYKDAEIYGYVKEENIASKKIFEGLCLRYFKGDS